jgi:amino acid transporter
VARTLKRIVVGRPIGSDRAGEQLMPKWMALPILCSDPLSSVAYATDEIILVLAMGGVAWIARTPFVALAVATLIVIIVMSYRQTCYAYPSGGGAYAVSRANLGDNPALIAASALMIDYIMTVAVSISSGVANFASAFPAIAQHAVPITLACIAILALMNLRGVRESGRLFAVPTYGFIVSVLVLVVWGLIKVVTGQPMVAPSASLQFRQVENVTGLTGAVLLLRAFASGCTALTGVEAISNAVPHFRAPKSRNASTTLLFMLGLSVTMFGGTALLATKAGIKLAHENSMLGLADGAVQQTVLAQLGSAISGNGTILFYVVQVFTAAVLLMAANTAYNGFPILAGILAKDDFLPRQFARRGDRLSFSNGIVALSMIAAFLVYIFDAEVSKLIQLYILGVFLSFTLSQVGMVRHWNTELRSGRSTLSSAAINRKRLLNAIGAGATGVVLVVVLFTKFTHGAWIVCIAIPLFWTLMRAVKAHYEKVDAKLRPKGRMTLPSNVHAVVLISRLHQPALNAISFARATRPATIVALTVQTDPQESRELMADWQAQAIPVSLVVVDSPYREISRPIIEYVSSMHRRSPRDVIAVYVPEYVVTHWWEHILHNQTALRIKTRLLFLPGVMVTSVPTQLGVEHEFTGLAEVAG